MSVSSAVPARKVRQAQPEPLDADLLRRRREQVVAEVAAVVGAGLEAMPLFGDGALDCGGLEQRVQALLRPVGGLLVGWGLAERVRACEVEPPQCPRDQRRMHRQERERSLEGLVGPCRYARGYYTCPVCGDCVAPADEVLGIGPGSLTPGLSRVAGLNAVQDPFGQAVRVLNETLGTTLNEDVVYRTAEALGAVAEAEMAVGAPPPDVEAPLLSDTLLIGADGTTSHVDGDWHEVKVGVVVPLGPQRETGPDGQPDALLQGEKTYCAWVGGADDFFPRLEGLARLQGLGHPGLRSVVLIGDGGAWIWKRAPRFDRPGVERIEILDYIHACQHIHDLAERLYGKDTPRARRFAHRLTEERLRTQGPAPALAALRRLRGTCPADRDAVRATIDFLQPHADAGRLDYPRFAALGLPIASGIVESGCNSLVCLRTKGPGKRWRRGGAQSILALRSLFLAPTRWANFFTKHPCLRRPPIATLRTGPHAA